MATLVCFHAHPDDESITTGGLMARAAAAGHRVVLVCATNGELGEPVPGVLAEGETLGERRIVEIAESAAALGAEAPRMLGYHDSGMDGEPSNDDPACFWQADVETAAAQLVEILTEVEADVVTIYDDHGGYGHPDHIQVHRVGLRAAELAGVEHVYEATTNRDAMKAMLGQLPPEENDFDPELLEVFGTPEADLSYVIDVTDQTGAKRASMRAHRSQIADDSFFLAMPPEAFAQAFGTESFNVPGITATGGPTAVDLLPGLG
ncbi:MAG: PIG-L family deacetylase [Acidimicrobiales bacterium]